MIKISRRQFITTTAVGASVSVGSCFAKSAGADELFDFTKPLADGRRYPENGPLKTFRAPPGMGARLYNARPTMNTT